MNNHNEQTLPAPAELLDWGSFLSANNFLDMAPEFPSYFRHLSAIRPQQDYEFKDIKEQIANALNDQKFSDWTITYDENDVEWKAEYEDTNRTDDYGTGPFRLTVLVSLYWDPQTRKHIVQVRAVQRSGEFGVSITKPFEDHLTNMFANAEQRPIS